MATSRAEEPTLTPSISNNTFIKIFKNYIKPSLLQAINSETNDKKIQKSCREIVNRIYATDELNKNLANQSKELIATILAKNKNDPLKELKKNYGTCLSILFLICGMCEISEDESEIYLGDINFSDGLYICTNPVIKDFLHLCRGFGRLLLGDRIVAAKNDIENVSHTEENLCTSLKINLLKEINTFTAEKKNYFIVPSSDVQTLTDKLKTAILANDKIQAFSLFQNFKQIDDQLYTDDQYAEVNFWMTILYIRLLDNDPNQPYEEKDEQEHYDNKLLNFLELSFDFTQDPVDLIFKYFNIIRQIFPENANKKIIHFFGAILEISNKNDEIYFSYIGSHEVAYIYTLDNSKAKQEKINQERQKQKQHQHEKLQDISRANKLRKEVLTKKNNDNKIRKELEHQQKLETHLKEAKSNETTHNNKLEKAKIKESEFNILHSKKIVNVSFAQAKIEKSNLKLKNAEKKLEDIKLRQQVTLHQQALNLYNESLELPNEIKNIREKVELQIKVLESNERQARIKKNKNALYKILFNHHEINILRSIYRKGYQLSTQPCAKGSFVPILQSIENDDFDFSRLQKELDNDIDLHMQIIDPSAFDEAVNFFKSLGFNEKNNQSDEDQTDSPYLNLIYHLESGIDLELSLSKIHKETPNPIVITKGKAILIETEDGIDFKVIQYAPFLLAILNHKFAIEEPNDKFTSYAYLLYKCEKKYEDDYEITDLPITKRKLRQHYIQTLRAKKNTIYLELYDFISHNKFVDPRASEILSIIFNALIANKIFVSKDEVLSQYAQSLMELATKLYSVNGNLFHPDKNTQFPRQIDSLVKNFIEMNQICILLSGQNRINMSLTLTQLRNTFHEIICNHINQTTRKELKKCASDLASLINEIYHHNPKLFNHSQTTSIAYINLLVNLYLQGNSPTVILSKFYKPKSDNLLFDINNWNRIFNFKKTISSVFTTIVIDKNQLQQDKHLHQSDSQMQNSMSQEKVQPVTSVSLSTFPQHQSQLSQTYYSQSPTTNDHATSAYIINSLNSRLDLVKMSKNKHTKPHPIGAPIEPTRLPRGLIRVSSADSALFSEHRDHDTDQPNSKQKPAHPQRKMNIKVTTEQKQEKSETKEDRQQNKKS